MSVESLKATFEKEPGFSKACELIKLLEKKGFEAYVVGGAVRDALLGRKLHDFDLCTSATPLKMKDCFKGFKILTHGEDFGTLTLVVEDDSYEITTYRGESKYTDSRHPDEIEFLSSLEEDLKRRDFTINAMAFHPEKGLIDPVGGLEDIKSKRLRTVGDPEQRFKEDALRIARLFRFSLSLGFKIEEESLKAARSGFKSLLKVSKERIFSEIEKSLSGKPHLKEFEAFFKGDLETDSLKDRELSLFDKAYVILRVSEELNIDFKDYILNKKLKGASSWLQSMKNFEGFALESLFIKCIEHYELFGAEQESLWASVRILNQKALKSSFSYYEKKDLEEDLSVLKRDLKGPDLGKAILECKRKKVFGYKRA